LIDLVRQGVYCTFHPQKETLWNEMEEKINTIKAKYNLLPQAVSVN